MLIMFYLHMAGFEITLAKSDSVMKTTVCKGLSGVQRYMEHMTAEGKCLTYGTAAKLTFQERCK